LLLTWRTFICFILHIHVFVIYDHSTWNILGIVSTALSEYSCNVIDVHIIVKGSCVVLELFHSLLAEQYSVLDNYLFSYKICLNYANRTCWFALLLL
jgi:hypothetical protein